MTKTVTKYYCDRCGEEVAVGLTICCKTNPETAIRIQQRSEWVWADLCDKCKESFKAWWEKSSTSPTGAESEEE